MKPGSKPKPTELKRLEGNPGKRRLNKNEPQPDPTVPKCPWWFNYEARKEWERITPELHRLGLLTLIDHAALEGYCIAYAMLVQAAKDILGDGIIYNYHDTKSLKMKRVKKPEVAVVRDSLNQIRLFCAEFGLTPSSRGRMTLPSEGKDESELEKAIREAEAKL
jgi:P27 family predicted phage terminase small subunit